jgi:hypothetical protein
MSRALSAASPELVHFPDLIDEIASRIVVVRAGRQWQEMLSTDTLYQLHRPQAEASIIVLPVLKKVIEFGWLNFDGLQTISHVS